MSVNLTLLATPLCGQQTIQTLNETGRYGITDTSWYGAIGTSNISTYALCNIMSLG